MRLAAAWLCISLLYSLGKQAAGACEGNSCPEDQAAAQRDHLLGTSAPSCPQTKKYPQDGSKLKPVSFFLPAVHHGQPVLATPALLLHISPGLHKILWQRAIYRGLLVDKQLCATAQVELEAAVVDLWWAGTLEETDKVGSNMGSSFRKPGRGACR